MAARRARHKSYGVGASLWYLLSLAKPTTVNRLQWARANPISRQILGDDRHLALGSMRTRNPDANLASTEGE